MANVVQHYLSVENIKKLLTDAGVVFSKTLHGRRGREVYCRTVLDMKKCCASEWEKEEAEAVAYGVLDFSQKNAEGHYGARRDLTDEEIEELHYWPIVFNSDNDIVWESCWNSNDNPAFFISKLFPNLEFKFEKYYEGRCDGIYHVKNGEFIATEEWATILSDIDSNRAAECSSELVEDIPF